MVTGTSEDGIAIIATTVEEADKFADRLGVINNSMIIETKYFTVNVPVVRMTHVDVGRLDSSTALKAVILVGGPQLMSHSLLADAEDDEIRIFFSDAETELERCIDCGFELVVDMDEEESGVARVREALKCRMWAEPSTEDATPDLSEENMMEQFDDLLRRVQEVRNGTLSDSDRRLRAAAIANEFAALLGDDDE